MDRHLSPFKRQKTNFGKTNQLDHINKLPDDLLLVILDKLPMEAAINTSLISKRWKGLWKSKSRIDIGYSWIEKTRKMFLNFLDKLLCAYQESKIKCISLTHQHYRSKYFEIELLMGKAALRNVEEIHLDLNDKEDTREKWIRRYPSAIMPEYLPKHEIRPYSFLKILSLKFARLKTLPPLWFVALRELYLEHVKLSDDTVEKITTNCSSLELLYLCNCNPTSDLKILVAACSTLVCLIIKEEVTEVGNGTKLFIRAMNVKTVEFGIELPRKEYHLEGTLKCFELTFRLNEMHHTQQALRVHSEGLRESSSNNFLRILYGSRVAKMLKLSSWCIQVLSMEVVKFKAPKLFEATHLTLETGLERWEFPGIAYMLLSCYKLQNLVIVMGDHAEINLNCVEGYKYRGAPNVDYPKALQGLTMVEFKNLYGNYQTWKDGSFDSDQFFSGFRFGALLLWNLRTYAKNLRKIVFVTRRRRYETDQFQSFRKLP